MLIMKSGLVTLAMALLFFQNSTGYKVETRYPVPGNGGYDYLTIDSAARRLYLSHGTQVDVIDPDNGKLIGTIADTPGVHGIAIASEFKHGLPATAARTKFRCSTQPRFSSSIRSMWGKDRTESITIPERSAC